MATVSKRCRCGNTVPLVDGHKRHVLCLGLHHEQSTLCHPSVNALAALWWSRWPSSSAPPCAEAIDDKLPCPQQKANKDAIGQLASVPIPSTIHRSTPDHNLTCPSSLARMQSPSVLCLADSKEVRASPPNTPSSQERRVPKAFLVSDMLDLLELATRAIQISWPDPSSTAHSRLKGWFYDAHPPPSIRPLQALSCSKKRVIWPTCSLAQAQGKMRRLRRTWQSFT